MAIQITTDFLEKMGMSKSEFLIELAVHFYDIGKMSMGQARKFAAIDQIRLQKEMKKINVLATNRQNKKTSKFVYMLYAYRMFKQTKKSCYLT